MYVCVCVRACACVRVCVRACMYVSPSALFPGVRGTSYTGDIAIDDLLFTDGNCIGLCSSVKPVQRVDCGNIGITQAQCRNKGCCWDDVVPNVPWCFFHPSACSSVKPINRRDCGFNGITQQQCQGLGCCWDTATPNSPWCFHGPNVPTAFPTTPPLPTTQPPSKWDCNFESGFCNWNNSREDLFDWYRQTGSTGSTNTGPSADHTLGSLRGLLKLSLTCLRDGMI